MDEEDVTVDEEDVTVDVTVDEDKDGKVCNMETTDALNVTTNCSRNASEDQVMRDETRRDFSCRRSWRIHGKPWKLEEMHTSEKTGINNKSSQILLTTDLDECFFNRGFWKIRGDVENGS